MPIQRPCKRARLFDSDDVEQYSQEMQSIAPTTNLNTAIAELKLKIRGLERVLLQERDNLLFFENQSQQMGQTIQTRIKRLNKSIHLYHKLNLPLKLNKYYRNRGINYCGQIATGRVSSVVNLQAQIKFDFENERNFIKKSRYHKKTDAGFDFKISQFIKTSNLLLFNHNGVFLQVNTRFPCFYQELIVFLLPEIVTEVLEFIS